MANIVYLIYILKLINIKFIILYKNIFPVIINLRATLCDI